jgi:hypothetical protein
LRDALEVQTGHRFTREEHKQWLKQGPHKIKLADKCVRMEAERERDLYRVVLMDIYDRINPHASFDEWLQSELDR